MKLRKLIAVAAVATFTLSSAASALTVKMKGPAAGSYEYLGVHADGVATYRSVGAGAFALKDRTPAPNNVFGNFVAFCLDLAADAPSGRNNYYSVTSIPFTNLNLIASGAIHRIQSLFDAVYTAGLATDDTKTSAAFQVALWNAVYDNDNSVNSGSFVAWGNSGVLNLANQYLAAASAYVGDKKWNLSYLENENYYRRQNLVTASPVPIPAAGLMLLGALGGLTLLRRRRRVAA
ncbi:VPLPA-CTERM sorting domain-containing protein [Ruegeria sp. Ofav3-42]|uniref:VPLPA-CTERM sorting domain-containing protein n=1 Tax=Ruegeria sp. Ofav3-42 TaxID=2917759 RepID=UPI001EF3F8EF|nr:VPLPA-CTERM sorting domain-containing protein [Ruegeria sp. Ofav3-42]MCG7522412.1 VPLPA-CTERM sorting domain-containing protein [Ruegeria sp. Ofav3-42]